MKDADVRQQFMLRRAQFKSFDTIAKELNVRKQTLITWEERIQGGNRKPQGDQA